MTKFIKNSKFFGFGIVGVIIIIAAVAVLGGFFGYQYLKIQNIQEGAKAPPIKPPVTPPAQVQPQTDEIDTSTWKTYRNEKYGFEVGYPKEFLLETTRRGDLFLSNYKVYVTSGEGEPSYSANLELYIAPMYRAQSPDETFTPISIGENAFLVSRPKSAKIVENYYLKTPDGGWVYFWHHSNTKDPEVRGHPQFLNEQEQVELVRVILSTFKFIK